MEEGIVANAAMKQKGRNVSVDGPPRSGVAIGTEWTERREHGEGL